MESAHPATHSDRNSPNFADSAIDMELSDKGSISHIPDTDTRPLPDRLTRLAHLATQENTRFSEDDSNTLHRCLDTIESLLDPRPALTQEISKCRPQSVHSGTATTVTCRPAAGDRAEPADEADHPYLRDILEQVTALNVELTERRNESFRIYNLFGIKCQALSSRISELESEIHELQADILENSIEREGLRGTIHGLEGWVDGWQQEYELAKSIKVSQRNGKRWKCKSQVLEDNESELLLDGIAGWMRGWKDVDEGFRIREQERQRRRDERQKQRFEARDQERVSQHQESINHGEGTVALNSSTMQVDSPLTKTPGNASAIYSTARA